MFCPAVQTYLFHFLIYLFSCAHIFSQERHAKPSPDPYLCLLPEDTAWLPMFWSFYLIKKMNFRLCFLTPSEIGCHILALIAGTRCWNGLAIRRRRFFYLYFVDLWELSYPDRASTTTTTATRKCWCESGYLESFWDLKVSIDRDKKLKDVHGDFFHSIKDAKSFKSTSIDRKGAWKMLNWADTDVQAHTIWINDKLQLG